MRIHCYERQLDRPIREPFNLFTNDGRKASLRTTVGSFAESPIRRVACDALAARLIWGWCAQVIANAVRSAAARAVRCASTIVPVSHASATPSPRHRGFTCMWR